MGDETGSFRYAGVIAARGGRRIDRRFGWGGRTTVTVEKEGIGFVLTSGFPWMEPRYVQRADLAHVYPVRSRRISPTGLAAAIIPSISVIAVRLVTGPIGLFGDRDIYTFTPAEDTAPELIDLLAKLEYRVDRKLRTRRLFWEDEVQSAP